MARPRWRTPLTDQLFEATLQLESVEECERFFEDLCTLREIADLSQRLEIARLLHSGAKYEEVVQAMRQAIGSEHVPSTATISRINRFLRYGADGYRLILDRLAPAPVLDVTNPLIEEIPPGGMVEVRPLLLELLAEDQRHYGGDAPDRTAIASLVSEVAPSFSGENLLLGVRVDGGLAAFCWVVFYNPGTGYEAEIAEVYVRPEHRGRGLARALVARAVAVFRERGVTFASVWTHPANEVAVRLYRDAGFAPTEQLVLTWLPDGR